MKRLLQLSILFVLCMGASQNACAATDLGWRSVGVDVGFVDPEHVDGTFGLGAFADLGTLAPRFHLAPRVGYWSKSEDSFGVEASVSDISFGARGLYMFPVSSRAFQPYAGGGLGFHIVSAKVTIPDEVIGGFLVPGFTVEDSSTKVGMDLGGGFVTPLSPKTDLTGDLWYTVVEDVSHMSFKIGVAMKLGK